MAKDNIVDLFPTGLVMCRYTEDYSKELEFIKKQPIQKSPRTYNKQSTDTFILDRPELKNIRAFIELKAQNYLEEVLGSDRQLVITQSWINVNSQREIHREHRHPNSLISGVWYPQVSRTSPPIAFQSNEYYMDIEFKRLTQYNCNAHLIPVEKGHLLLFPSKILHSVPENQSYEDRISLSFNTWIKGDLGEKEKLTYLPLDRCV